MRVSHILILCVLVLGSVATTSFGTNVTYDHRAIVIDGQRRTLISGSIHYPRSTPDMWPELIQKAKEGGLDVIETYVFWNLHEPIRYQYDFTGQKDLVRFIKLVAEAGLYAFLRIGPYICSEWNFGGFPVWLHFLPQIEFRTNNEPFKAEMQRFTTLIVNMMKIENLFASQGGPIILSQIENEYGNIQLDFKAGGKPYMEWAANMANSLDTGVPWVMCRQNDAPDPMINTCNDYYCDQDNKFKPNSPNKPRIWTECWSGWNTFWGEAVPYRPVEDLAFAVARFFQRGGIMSNYYMYHGGTNFGRTSGGPFIPTTYDYGAPIDEYGLLNQPMWGHLKDLHKAIKLCEPAIVATDPIITALGTNLEVGVYGTKSGLCAAFLANVNEKSDAFVNFNSNTYHLPAWSVSILPDCKNVVFNTAKVNSVSAKAKFIGPFSEKNNFDAPKAFKSWSYFCEPIGISSNKSVAHPKLLEQISTTMDESDYFWYSVSIKIEGNEPFLQNLTQTTLHVESKGHALLTFVNGKLAGSGKGANSKREFLVDVPITFVKGKNSIDLLSYTVGLQNYGAHFEMLPAGLAGPIYLYAGCGSLDLTTKLWTNQIGLKGEELGLSDGASSGKVQENGKQGPLIWLPGQELPKNQPLTWYKTTFDTPSGTDPVALDLTGLGKGMIWINGQSIGRYWQNYIVADTGCTDTCDYKGNYEPHKCLRNCGKATQQFYHVPRSWLKQTRNTLVVFEEMGGDPTQICIATRHIASICAFVSEDNPRYVDMWNPQQNNENESEPTLLLECPSRNQVISSIKFSSFGNPQGTCGSFSHGSCNNPNATSIVTKECVGKKSCSIGVSVAKFGDPCNGAVKSLAVEATCK